MISNAGTSEKHRLMAAQSSGHLPEVSTGDNYDMWRDLLGRRLVCRPLEQPSLALSPDGRVALSAGNNVSLVYCRAAVLAALAAPELGSISLQELFDEAQREARGIRAPAVAHVPVDDQPATALTWLQPPVLLATPTKDGPLRLLTPIARSLKPVFPEGTWGLSDGLWSVSTTCDGVDSVIAQRVNGSCGPVARRGSRHIKNKTQAVSPDEAQNRNNIDVCEPIPDALHTTKDMKSQSDSTSSHVLCMTSFGLNASDGEGRAILDSDSSVRRAWFTAFGKRGGTTLRRWKSLKSGFGEDFHLWNKWTSCIAVAESSDFINATGVKLALGSPSGSVRVFAVSWVPKCDNEFNLEVEPFWNGADNVLRGPIACIAFRPFPSDSCNICFAIAVGNSVAGVQIDENSEGEKRVCKARVSLAYEAHYESVTSLCFLPDGSVLSSSSDGSVSRYMFNWEEGTEPCTFLEIVYGKSLCSDSVVAMQPTPSCMLILHLMTRPAVKGEIGEPAVMVKKKYHYLGRTSLLGVLAYPIRVESQLRQALEYSLERLIEIGKYSDVPLTLWDIELWLRANEQHRKQGEGILCDYLSRVRLLIDTETNPSVANRLRKLALCIATALSRFVDNFDEVHPTVKEEQSALRVSVLVAYHMANLDRFSRTFSASLADSVSSAQLQALEAKLRFVTAQRDCLSWNRDAFDNTLRVVSGMLPGHFSGRVESRTLSMCIVCEDLPLVVDRNDPESFWCGNGDFSARCVKSALPCTDCVPRVCGGCGALARCETSEDAPVPWDDDPYTCPLCNCELLHGRAEKQVELFKQFS